VAQKDLVERITKFNRPYLRMVFGPGDPGQVPVTKLSGVPWWPAAIDRPTCVDGHRMAFVGQFRLDEAPGFSQPPTLLSFHYCEKCTDNGLMPFGWEDRGRQLRYRVSLFSDLDSPADGLGVVADSRVVAQTPRFEAGLETLNIEGIWENFPETRVPHGVPESPNIFHETRSKLGGWPSWEQHPVRPEDQMGEEMQFVGQLDRFDCEDAAWNCGYAYLFASVDEQEAELVVQTS
jgi:uncharacterized protein YwqG